MVELRTDGKNFQPKSKPGECGCDHVWVGEEGVATERRREGAPKKKERWSRRALPRACPAISLENELHNSSINIRYLVRCRV